MNSIVHVALVVVPMFSADLRSVPILSTELRSVLLSTELRSRGQGPQTDPVPAPVEGEEQPTTATPEVSGQLMGLHRLALEAGDGAELATVLGRMAGHDNAEFREAALLALAYKPTRADRDAERELALELGIATRKEIEALVEQRVARVQAAAAWVLAAQRGDERVGAQLLRVLRGRGFLDARPEAAAAVIEALGKIGDRRAERDIDKELKRFGDPRIQRACIRYFGWIETRERDIVRFLCEQLDAPEPGSVDSATNPPASYWEERWKAWSHWRRDLTWSLRRITGETFQPAEGGAPSDRQKALAWLEQHGPGRGIR